MSPVSSGLESKGLISNIIITMGRQLSVGLLQLLFVIAIARMLGPEGNGIYSVALLLPGLLVNMLNLGVGPANVYYVASGKRDMAAAYSSSMILAPIISVLGFIIGATLIEFYSEAWFPGVPDIILWLAILAFPIGIFQLYLLSLLQAQHQFRQYNLVLLFAPIVNLIMLALLYLFDYVDLKVMMLVQLAGGGGSLGLTFYFMRGKRIICQKGKQFNHIKEVVNYGYKAHLSNILAYFYYKADLFSVNILVNPASAGIYAIAVQLSERLWLISQAVSTVLLPRLAGMTEEDKRKKLTPVIFRLVLLFTSLMAILFWFVGKLLIDLIFGSEYLQSYEVIQYLLPGIVVTSGSRVLANDIAARGRPDLNMYTSVFVLIINIIGNIILIPWLGVVGAALATSIAYVLNFSLRIWIYCSFVGVSFRHLLSFNFQELHLLIVSIKRGGV